MTTTGYLFVRNDQLSTAVLETPQDISISAADTSLAKP
jgi:hypothetical protein